MRDYWRCPKLFHAYVVGDSGCVGESVWGMENYKVGAFCSDISLKDLIRGATEDSSERGMIREPGRLGFLSLEEKIKTQ